MAVPTSVRNRAPVPQVRTPQPHAAAEASTFEDNILKSVIRASWKDSLATGSAAKETAFSLDEHASRMRLLLNNAYDYEIASMPIIVANAANMNAEELRGYLAHLEAFALGYGSLLGQELTNLIMLGLPRKARDRRSAARYTSLLVKELEGKRAAYLVRAAREEEASNRATSTLIEQSSGILRFFRRSRITSLKRRVAKTTSRRRSLETKAQRYSYLLDRVKERSTGK